MHIKLKFIVAPRQNYCAHTAHWTPDLAALQKVLDRNCLDHGRGRVYPGMRGRRPPFKGPLFQKGDKRTLIGASFSHRALVEPLRHPHRHTQRVFQRSLARCDPQFLSHHF